MTPKWPEFDVVKENDEQAKLRMNKTLIEPLVLENCQKFSQTLKSE